MSRFFRAVLLIVCMVPLMANACAPNQCGNFAEGGGEESSLVLPTAPTIYCGDVTTLDNRPGTVSGEGGDGTGGEGGEGGTGGTGGAGGDDECDTGE